MRLIKSDRGTEFYFWKRSATDLIFPKYPRLPVVRCSGYEEAKTDFIRQIPVGRFGQTTEIANAVVFLASDEAAFTVGAELLIDGGHEPVAFNAITSNHRKAGYLSAGHYRCSQPAALFPI